MKDKKLISILSVMALSLVLLGYFVFCLYNDNKVYSKYVYGTVLEKGDNYIKVLGIDNAVYFGKLTDDVVSGDIVVVEYDTKRDFKNGNGNLSVIMDKKETDVIVDDEVSDVEDDPVDYFTQTTTKMTTKTTTKKTTQTTTTNQDVLDYIQSQYEKVDEEGKVKQLFITLVDFIFFDGKIKNVRFKDLSAAVKCKVVYYAILVDNKIDDKYPDYKANLNKKYDAIKAKLLAKYMDLTTSICEDNSETCKRVRNDFDLMKKTFNWSWDIIRDAFIYAYDKGKTRLVDWYMIFSGKK